MVKKTKKQELADAKANAIDAEIIGETAPADAAPMQITMNEAIEQINTAFAAIASNVKTLSTLIENDLKVVGGNIQLLINAVNTLATELDTVKNQQA